MNKETICKDKNCKFFKTCLIKDVEILRKCTGREKKVKVEK
ncbi:hypothetical protein [Paraclostridium bifermentans]|nr:hypothetical protein [Paraclostridium bifermentans]